MVLEQFYLPCLAHASYLVGDETTGAAAVVDPQRDVAGYLEAAAARGLRITHVILTHLHADFIAGHLELRDRVGATICLGAAAKADYPFLPLHDGDVVSLGRVQLRVLETPGHTPESITLVVHDLDNFDGGTSKPVAALTGDTLFVGDVGRPDLRVALGWSASSLGALLYDSLHSKLLALPDQTLVYPAHGAGSLCGKAIGRETFSSIGAERHTNYALQPMERSDFVNLVTADQPDAPPYFTYDAVLNTRERPTLDQTLAGLTALTLERVLALQASGAQILDSRDPAEFAAAHLRGSVNVGLVGQYATWAGTVLVHDRPIVLVTDPGREAESAMRLGRIGFDAVAGYLNDGLASLADRPELTSATERLSPLLAAERAAGGTLVVDVRAQTERSSGAIPGSLSLPLSQLSRRLNELPRDRPLLVHCAGGYRSSIATSVLKAEGFTEVSELAGGIAAWEHAGQPVTAREA